MHGPDSQTGRDEEIANLSKIADNVRTMLLGNPNVIIDQIEKAILFYKIGEYEIAYLFLRLTRCLSKSLELDRKLDKALDACEERIPYREPYPLFYEKFKIDHPLSKLMDNWLIR